MQRFSLPLLCLACVIALGGCFGGSPASVPSDHYYRLPQNKPVSVLPAPIIKGTLAIRKFQAHGLYHGRPLLYINSETPLEVHRYHYHHWTESPPQLIQENLLHYFRNKQLADEVTRFQPGRSTDYSVAGRIVQFERVVQNQRISVHVRLELELQSTQQQPVFHREYSAIIDVPDKQLHTTVSRYGTALQQIYEAFTQDIQAALSSDRG